MKKLNMMGIGPKIGRIALPYFALTIFFSLYFKEIFTFGEKFFQLFMTVGIVLVFIGLVFYAITVRLLLKGIKKTTLQTTGTYYLCQNPLYSAIILWIIPGTSFLLNTWLVLSTSILAYILFKHYIQSEYKEMESVFGEGYLKYKKETPEFFPFPFRKWVGSTKYN